MADGSSVRLGEKANIWFFKARVTSENNANTEFEVRLDYHADSNFEDTLKTVLRIGNHGFLFDGSGDAVDENLGRYKELTLTIHNQDEAINAAEWLSVKCALRTPPGYKYSVQYIPLQSEFHTNEPVLVKLLIRNLDDRTIIFRSGGQQRGYRDNQYGFRAFYQFGVPVSDIGNPLNFGGFYGLIHLEPGKEFEDKAVDLNRWFKFDKAGIYSIHGFYHLEYYPPGKESEVTHPWSVIWSDYASADFTVVIK